MTMFAFNTRCILDDINSLLVPLLHNDSFICLDLLPGGDCDTTGPRAVNKILSRPCDYCCATRAVNITAR